MPLCSVFDLKGRLDSLETGSDGILPEFPKVPNSYASDSNGELYWVGREHWLMRSSIELEESLCSSLRP